MKYEKPDLEELELMIEGSFLSANTESGGKDDKNPGESEDDWA